MKTNHNQKTRARKPFAANVVAPHSAPSSCLSAAERIDDLLLRAEDGIAEALSAIVPAELGTIAVWETRHGQIIITHGPLSDIEAVWPALHREAVRFCTPGTVHVVVITARNEVRFFPVDIAPMPAVNSPGGSA